MRTISLGRNSKATAAISVIVFSVGGKRLVAKAVEIGGIWPWTHAIPVPSGTPFVSAILRHGDTILPIFDLAGRLQVQVKGEPCLCLIAKRCDGPMAVCIDGEIPTLQVLAPHSVHPSNGGDADVVGTCRIGDIDMPMYSLTNLGLSPQ
jgi:chemotaxis signal transduction protein